MLQLMRKDIFVRNEKAISFIYEYRNAAKNPLFQ